MSGRAVSAPLDIVDDGSSTMSWPNGYAKCTTVLSHHCSCVDIDFVGFLGVVALGGDQMGSGPVVADGVAQGPAVERVDLVVPGVIPVSACYGAVEVFGDDSDQDFADGVGGRRLAQVLCSLAEGLVATHAAQGCGGGEDGIDPTAPSCVCSGDRGCS